MPSLRLLINPSTDPLFNIALEEWLFEHHTEVVHLYRNADSVIVGKHQNTLAEIDYFYCQKAGVPVLRRISGGGTVYHDLGNINFSFIRNTEADKLIDFSRYTVPVANTIRAMGYPINISPRNDLLLEGKKISGNAQHTKQGKALHHGTILYDAQLDSLAQSIKRKNGVVQSKGVKSVRSVVANLKDHSDLGDTEAFFNAFATGLREQLSISDTLTLSANDMQEISRLASGKYASWEWNYGRSPSYELKQGATIESQEWHVVLDVERGGRIRQATVTVNGEDKQELSYDLTGVQHNPKIIETIASRYLPKERVPAFIGMCF